MSSNCVQVNGWNQEYEEITCLYPSLANFAFEFEKKYNPRPILEWTQNHPVVPIVAVILYFILIFAGKWAMADKEAFRWRTSLAVWNLFLSTFSAIGVFRTAPRLFHSFSTMSFRDNLCLDPRIVYGSGSSGLWTALFIYSKFPELFDTFFIVIHKKPLIFLHWYHHITVLLYCWHSYANPAPLGIIFTVMNYSVHASMYFYYFLMAIRMKPKWIRPIVLTAMQIAQMVVGVFFSMMSFYYYLTDEGCLVQKENNIAAFVMYGSYLILFCQFFFSRYFKSQVKVVPKKKKV